MGLRIYNTFRRRREDFVPLKKGSVGMYVCGVTVYDDCHLGHARAYVNFDIIRRYLEYRGYRVKHIQNFTDIDDKVIARAHAYREKHGNKMSLSEAVGFITDKYTAEYFRYMDKLNIKRADLYPKATEHIQEMVALVDGLVGKGYAYTVEGDVFFSVEKFADYGKLSGRKLDDMRAGARVEVDERKKHPLDFALWKSAKEGEPFWESPWGKGRPGWHIECSVMSMKYLGESFDIHGGGQDLIFPHHENELAQAESYTGKRFARYWLHNGFVTVNKEKMSKSLGNFFTLREIFEKYDPQVVRLFLISTHYRHPIDFSDEELENARRGYERLVECYGKLKELVQLTPERKTVTRFRKEFEEHMDNDFNTSGAVAVIFDMVKFLNTELGRKQTYSDEFVETAHEFSEFCEVMGLNPGEAGEPAHQVKIEDGARALSDEEVKKLLSVGAELGNSDVEKLLVQRQLERKAGNWDKADKIRDSLSKFVRIQDTPDGVLWKRILPDFGIEGGRK